MILIAAIIGVTLYFVSYQGYLGSLASTTHESSTSSSSSGPTATSMSSFDTTSSTSVGTMATTTGGWIIGACNCTLNLNEVWQAQTYSTMQDLASHSTAVIVGTVTSERTIGVNDTFWWGPNVGLVPVTDYNVTVTTVLFDSGNHFGIPISAGYSTIVPQVGGTFGHTTMNVTGYPTLAVGTPYVFFLTNHAPFEGNLDNGLATTGGPQGLFYIQGGSVYSLDNMYPQAYTWLPVKADGVPLAQFIQEVQSASSSTTVSSSASSSSSSSAVHG